METSNISILKNLIISCRNYDLKSFIPYLMSEKVKTNYNNKVQFYSYLKKRLQNSKLNTKGILVCKIEKKDWQLNINSHLFNFYDQFHINERLSIEVEIEKNKIILDIPPF